MKDRHLHKIFFISESAAIIDFGNKINEEINKNVIAVFNYLSQHPLPGMIEALPAYCSVTVYFDVPALRKKIAARKKAYEFITEELEALMRHNFAVDSEQRNLLRIPVCYEDEFAADMDWIGRQKNMSKEEIIALHHSKPYRVYMLGFLPGFSYMAEVPEEIVVPRKPQPQPVVAGSVGIAGRQTGIYPLNSPGGWQIVGRTPLKMFDQNKARSCLLKAGDYVEFYPISKNEFENYQIGSA